MPRSSHGWVYVSAEDIRESPADLTPGRKRRKSSDGSASTDSERGDTENYASCPVKTFNTTLAYMLMLGFGFTMSMLGPCLLDIASLYSIPSDRAATMFMWRGIGSLVGHLTYGKLYDTFRESVVLVPTLLLSAAVTAAVPWAPMYAVASILFGLQGFTMSALSVCSHVILLRYWGSKNGPFLQALHLMYPIAALFTPQVVQPFLMSRIPTQDLVMNLTNISDLHNQTWPLLSTKSEIIIVPKTSRPPSLENISTFYTFENVTATTKEPDSGGMRLYYAYVINAGILVFLALVALAQVCYVRKCRRKNQIDDLMETEKPSTRKQLFEKFLWVIFFITTLCLGSLELTYYGLLFTFVVEHLHWSNSDGTLLLTITSACAGFGRLVGILASSFAKPQLILGIDYMLILTTLFCLAVLVHTHPVVVWVCCSLLALGTATVFASTLTWARDFFHVTGVFTSVYLVGYSTGALSGPALVGYLFKQFHALWYFYMLIIFVGSMAFLYSLLLLISCFVNRSRKREPLEPNIVEMKGMLQPSPIENGTSGTAEA